MGEAIGRAVSSIGFCNIFMMFTLVMLLIVAVVLILSEETKGRTLEDING